MRKISLRVLRPNPAWNLQKLLKLMLATLVLHLASVFWYMCYLFSN